MSSDEGTIQDITSTPFVLDGERVQLAVQDQVGAIMWWFTTDMQFRCPSMENRIAEVVQGCGAAPELEERVKAAVLATIGQAIEAFIPGR